MDKYLMISAWTKIIGSQDPLTEEELANLKSHFMTRTVLVDIPDECANMIQEMTVDTTREVLISALSSTIIKTMLIRYNL